MATRTADLGFTDEEWALIMEHQARRSANGAPSADSLKEWLRTPLTMEELEAREIRPHKMD